VGQERISLCNRFEIVTDWLVRHHVCSSALVQTLPTFNKHYQEETQMNSKCIHYSNDVSADLDSLVFQQVSFFTTIVRKVSKFFIRLKIEQEQMQSRNRMKRKQELETRLYRDGLELPLEEKLKLRMYRYLV